MMPAVRDMLSLAFVLGLAWPASLGTAETMAGPIDLGALGIGRPVVEKTGPLEPADLDYLLVHQDAPAFFEILAADASLRLDISPKVNGTLSDLRLVGSVDQVMAQTTGSLGLDWFTFNGVLYISDQSEALTRLVRLGDLDPPKVIDLLVASGLPMGRMKVKPSADGSALALSGPPKFLALAEAMIEGIPPKNVATAAPSRTITVRRATDTETIRLP